MTADMDLRRALPGVDRLLEEEAVGRWTARWGRAAVTEALRRALEEERSRLAGEPDVAPETEAEDDADGWDSAAAGELRRRVLERARRRLEAEARPSLRPVLNGTGVVLHTNLGRAPLHPEAGAAARRAAEGYVNLEYDLAAGERGSRYAHCRDLLARLAGTETSLVVNNNAAAVALVVHGLARGREVLVARGELVEIGGSFRLPEVVESAGGELVEVGTTNRTRPGDYERALGPETGLILKVHPSNYRVEGFTEDAPLRELARIGERADVPVAHDLGSGLLAPDLLEGYPEEPTPADSARSGADLATWSGDKLLGGPQAGLVTGSREAIAPLTEDPLLRALRVDKTTLAALEATLRAYREGRGEELPTLRALREPRESVERRAREALERVERPAGAEVTVGATSARVGGGAYPDHEVPSAGWRVEGPPPHRLASACRRGEPPLVGRVTDGAFWVDFRALLPGQGDAAARVLSAALRSAGDGGEAGTGARDGRGTGGEGA